MAHRSARRRLSRERVDTIPRSEPEQDFFGVEAAMHHALHMVEGHDCASWASTARAEPSGKL